MEQDSQSHPDDIEDSANEPDYYSLNPGNLYDAASEPDHSRDPEETYELRRRRPATIQTYTVLEGRIPMFNAILHLRFDAMLKRRERKESSFASIAVGVRSALETSYPSPA